MTGRRIIVATALLLVLSLATGCGLFRGGLRGAPLPGGAPLGDNPYQVRIEFQNVLDLVPRALVKVNDVDVGTVDSIELDRSRWTAVVQVTVNGSVRLPANAEARVQSTSLLGEKYVQLRAPVGVGPQGRLTDGASIPLHRTGRGTEVEEVLGALSMLLNGGGVAQLQTIAGEVNRALAGNEAEIRSLLHDLNQLVSTLDARRGEITRAIDAVNRLSATLVAQRDHIATALEGLPPGFRVLADQRILLVRMLQDLDRLGDVAVDVINRSQQDTVADLQALRPVLNQLADAGADLPNSLELIGTIPFTDAAVDGIGGSDYTNLYATLEMDLTKVLGNVSSSNQGLMPGLPPLGNLLPPLPGLSLPPTAGAPGAPAPPPPPLLPGLLAPLPEAGR